MKTHTVILLVVGCLLTACDRRDNNSAATASDSANAQAWKDYNDSVKEQKEVYDRQAKSAAEQLQAQADLQKKAEALMTTQEQLLKRQQDAYDRFEKILATWESQQKQYQKYLDSLPK
jgi:membrane-bound lytic murein transglycosylase